jgi:DNA-binding transcriptional regulator LsrR (DeoR family)
LWGVARIGGGTVHVFYAPMIVDDAQTATVIRRQADALALVPCSRSSPAT